MDVTLQTDGWVMILDSGGPHGNNGVYLSPSEADFVFAKLKERDSNMRAAREAAGGKDEEAIRPGADPCGEGPNCGCGDDYTRGEGMV